MPRLLPLLVLVACGGDPIPPTAESCAAICEAAGTPAPAPAPKAEAPKPAPAAGGDLTAFEKQHVGPLLDDLRAGVRPLDDKGVGLCKGKDSCDTYLGLEAKDLPKGDYILQAILAVPKSGEDWSVELKTDCVTTKGDSESTKSNSKSYDVKYGGPDGYKLVPLRRISSPGKYGDQACTWTLTAPHPDGDKVIEGSWSIPGE